MVEHLFCKQAVAGSNPIAGSILRSASFGWRAILRSSNFGWQAILCQRRATTTSGSTAAAKDALRGLGEGARSSAPRFQRKFLTARWCNGSTNDSDSFCLGSSPSRAAIRRAPACSWPAAFVQRARRSWFEHSQVDLDSACMCHPGREAAVVLPPPVLANSPVSR